MAPGYSLHCLFLLSSVYRIRKFQEVSKSPVCEFRCCHWVYKGLDGFEIRIYQRSISSPVGRLKLLLPGALGIRLKSSTGFRENG